MVDHDAIVRAVMEGKANTLKNIRYLCWESRGCTAHSTFYGRNWWRGSSDAHTPDSPCRQLYGGLSQRRVVGCVRISSARNEQECGIAMPTHHGTVQRGLTLLCGARLHIRTTIKQRCARV